VISENWYSICIVLRIPADVLLINFVLGILPEHSNAF